MLEGATVTSDSIVGRLTHTDTLRGGRFARLRAADGQRSAIPVSAIVRVERREIDITRTLAPLAVAAFIVAIKIAARPRRPSTLDPCPGLVSCT